jgi:hypothetical protein
MRKIKPGSDSKFWQDPQENSGSEHFFIIRKSALTPNFFDPVFGNKKAAGFAAGGFFSTAARGRCSID